jgi:hypothetical protein
LPTEKLQESLGYIKNQDGSLTIKEKNKILVENLRSIADSLQIDLKLNAKLT